MSVVYVLHQILTPNVGLIKDTDDYAKTQLSAHVSVSDLEDYLASEGFSKTNHTAGVRNAPVYQKYIQAFDDTVNLSYTGLPLIGGAS